MAFVCCDPTDKNGPDNDYTSISGTIQNMPSGSYVLKAVVYDDDDDLVLAECNVAANGSFSLQLPETVPNAYLEGFGDLEDSDITISNPNAKVGSIYLELYDGDDEYVDDVYYASISITETAISLLQAMPTYCNAAVTATGTTKFDDEDEEDIPMTVSLSFAKGWGWTVLNLNVNLANETASASMTTKLPNGMRWYLQEYLDDNSPL